MSDHHEHFRARREDEQPRRNRRRPDHFETWAFGPGFGPGFGGPRRGRRSGRRGGDVRAAVLLLLAEQPRHGYELIQEIGERSNGGWNPSPGSVYPVLQQLEDEGLIVIEKVDGRKTASLTDEGQTYVSDNAEDLGTPWDDAQAGFDPNKLREVSMSIKGAMIAFRQVMETGTPAQREQAVGILDETKRKLYAILAADES